LKNKADRSIWAKDERRETMRKAVMAAVLLAAVPPAPAAAGVPVTQTMKCPIGGAEFRFTSTASYSTWGERPDGKPYGSWRFPLALPECPDNGLVLYKDYTAEEVAKLEPLVASGAYQALRAADTPYYRAYWLMREMGVEPERYLWALLQASWEADGKPELRARYLAELAEASARVEPRPGDLNWIGMEGRAVNALRELGRFDEALARLEKVPLLSLDIAIPEGEAVPAETQEARNARVRRGWLGYFKSLRAVMERRDKSAEPLDMIPRRFALASCLDGGDKLGEHDKAFCEKEKEGVEELRAARAKLDQDLQAVNRPRDEAGR
jgi:hypothetical protein